MIPGEAFQWLAANDPLVDVTLDYQISSGLTRPDFFDWPGHLVDVVDGDPDVVVLTFGANDAQGIITPGGDIYQPVEQGWLDEYRRRVAGTMESEAAARPWIRFVDTARTFSNPDGSYTDFLPGADGGLDSVRQGHGIHLSTAGAELLASEVREVLDDELELTSPALAPSTTVTPGG